MRISDWSSDVGSSDLPGVDVVNRFRCARYQQHAAIAGDRANLRLDEVIQFAQLRWRAQTGGVEDQRVIARFAGFGLRIALQIQLQRRGGKLGRASCRERVCQSGESSVVAVSLKK